MLMMSSILSVLHACNMHVTQQMQQFSLSTMPTSTSLFLFCFLHGRCDDLFSIATTMHNHTPRQPTAPSSSWLCQPKDSKAMPRKATLRCYHRPNHREVLGFHLEVSLKSETLTMPSRRKIIPMTSSSLAKRFWTKQAFAREHALHMTIIRHCQTSSQGTTVNHKKCWSHCQLNSRSACRLGSRMQKEVSNRAGRCSYLGVLSSSK
jgi:hypothetical protein